MIEQRSFASWELLAEWYKMRLAYICVGVIFPVLIILSVLQLNALVVAKSTDVKTVFIFAVNLSTSICATVGPLAGIICGVRSFSLEYRQRLWQTAFVIFGTYPRMIANKVLTSIVFATGVWVICFGLAALFGAFHPFLPVNDASVPILIVRVITAISMTGFWFTFAGFVVCLVRNPAIAAALTFLYALLELRISDLLGIGSFPLPVSSTLSLYSVLEYIPGSWVSSPSVISSVDAVTGIISMGAYWWIFVLSIIFLVRRFIETSNQ